MLHFEVSSNMVFWFYGNIRPLKLYTPIYSPKNKMKKSVSFKVVKNVQLYELPGTNEAPITR